VIDVDYTLFCFSILVCEVLCDGFCLTCCFVPVGVSFRPLKLCFGVLDRSILLTSFDGGPFCGPFAILELGLALMGTRFFFVTGVTVFGALG